MADNHNLEADTPDNNGGNANNRNNQPERVYPTIAIRYGYMNHLGEFTYSPNLELEHCGKVIVKTHRGIEIGEQVALTCSQRQPRVSREQIQTYIDNSGPECYQHGCGRILRQATPDDLHEDAHLRAGTEEKQQFCQGVADRLKLPLRVVACEHLFGGERVVFYFLAEGRVDFRVLVKELAGEYQTRIEMRQVGVRDEARLLGDYETCGRECCCKVFLKTLRPVSMKMAKMQKATLDPSKVSGRCGRLKCCLRYEHIGYEELDRKLPRIGTRVSSAHADGVVVSRQILTQLLRVQIESGALVTVPLEEVDGLGDAKPHRPRPKAAAERPRAAPKPGKAASKPPAQVADKPASKVKPPAEETAAAESDSEKPARRRKRRRKRSSKPRKKTEGSEPPPKKNDTHTADEG